MFQGSEILRKSRLAFPNGFRAGATFLSLLSHTAFVSRRGRWAGAAWGGVRAPETPGRVLPVASSGQAVRSEGHVRVWPPEPRPAGGVASWLRRGARGRQSVHPARTPRLSPRVTAGTGARPRVKAGALCAPSVPSGLPPRPSGVSGFPAGPALVHLRPRLCSPGGSSARQQGR